jgi:hypothetical protein
VSLEWRRHAGAFEGARQGALLKLVATLLAMMCSINDFFNRTDAFEVLGHAHLCEEIHSPLKIWKLALAFRSKEVITLNARLKWLLRQSEECWQRQNEGEGSDIGVVMMTILILTCLLSAALLLAVLAIARCPTSLLLLLLLVELGIFPLVLNCNNAVGILSVVVSIAATEVALFPGSFQSLGKVQ